MKINELKNYPIEELLEKKTPNKFYYLDKSFETEKNYHMYFYYKNGTYDVCDYVDGIETLSEKEYLEKMKNRLIDTIKFSYFDGIFDKYDKELEDIKNKDGEYEYFDGVKKLIVSETLSEEDKEYIKEYYLIFLKEEIEELKESFIPYRKKMEGNINKEELDTYNEIVDNINNTKNKLKSIEETYKYRDYSKNLSNIIDKQDNLLEKLKELKKE